jgi:O-glycosyl hydrolase
MILPVLAILAAQAIGCSALGTRQSTTAQAFCSSSDRVYNLSPFSAPVSGAGSPGSESTWALSIDDTASGYKQKVTGFGAAVTDATVSVINLLPADVRSQLLSELMTSAGADFSLLRHTIGASDLSAPPAYTYDDASGNVDTGLTSFGLGDRGTAMAQLLADMTALKPGLTILGSVWAPPAWMQLDDALTGTTVNVRFSVHTGRAALRVVSHSLFKFTDRHSAEQLEPRLR